MKKTLSLILALTLAMALAVPAFAAELKSDKYTYTLSDETVGTATVDLSVPQYGELGYINAEHVDETHTAYLVPWGTVVTNNDLYINFIIYWYDEDTGEYRDSVFSPRKSVTIGGEESGWSEWMTTDVIYSIGTLVSDKQGSYPEALQPWPSEDEVIYLKPVDSSATPAAPAETPADSAPAAPAPAETPAATTPAPAPAPTPSAPAGSGSYTAQKYDTYGKLAVNYYGSYAYTKALQQANGNKTLKEGTAVVLPDKLGDAVRLAPAAAGTGETLYTVLAGDTLGSIAQVHYGSSAQYKVIFERNADRLKNANTIYEGQIIVLPAK